MSPENFKTFLENVAAEMPAVRRALLSYVQGGSMASSLSPLVAVAQSLRDIAAESDDLHLAQTALDFQEILAFLVERGGPADSVERAALLDSLAALERAVIGRPLGNTALTDVDAFVDESFDSLWPGQEARAAVTKAAPPDEEGLFGFEIDDELLEVFALEADGLLHNIEESLAAFSENSSDLEALWEIRRNAHTFKGAAGIVGLKEPSELAHRIEDLLDSLAEAGHEAPRSVFSVLRHSTDCLRTMIGNAPQADLPARVASVYDEFERVFASLAKPLPNAVKARTRTAEVKAAAAPARAESNRDLLDLHLQESRPNSRQKSIVRVSVDRLDHLVKITRDLLIGRAVFEQQLRDLETQIDELHNATQRLQTTSGKLEIDFEASMLGSPFSAARASDFSVRAATSNQTPDFDELELDRYTEFHQSTRQLSEAASDTAAINNALDAVRGNLETLFEQQRTLFEQIQEKLIDIRMVEFSSLATRLQRAVTVTCEEENKKARLNIQNAAEQLDTQILEALTEPLMHLLKNAVVHGIEPPDTRRMLGKPEVGEIVLVVLNEETHITLTIADDGRGVDFEALKKRAVEAGRIHTRDAASMSDTQAYELMFVAGLTTAEKLSLSAGRGVGMSIVKESIDGRRGSISVESFPQKGTTFTVRIPLTLAVMRVLLVKAGRQTVAIPLKQVSRAIELPASEVEAAARKKVIEIESELIEIHKISDLVAFRPAPDGLGIYAPCLKIDTGEKSRVLIVDGIVRSEEVVIKSLGRPLDNIKGVLGAAILGNGELVPIIDLPHLFASAGAVLDEPVAEPVSERLIMVVDDSPSVRHMTSKLIAGVGWRVISAKDGLDALAQLKSCKKLPDVILSDIEMPRMDGYELASALRRSEDFNAIPVVVITSRSGDKHREKAFETGVSAYLTKPFQEKELLTTIEKLFDEKFVQQPAIQG